MGSGDDGVPAGKCCQQSLGDRGGRVGGKGRGWRGREGREGGGGGNGRADGEGGVTGGGVGRNRADGRGRLVHSMANNEGQLWRGVDEMGRFGGLGVLHWCRIALLHLKWPGFQNQQVQA